MGTMNFCGVKHTIKEWMKSENKKTMVLLLLIEVMFFLFVMYKGLGKNYLPITVVLSLFTTVGCALVFYWKADRYLLVIAVLLVNIGFVIQEISESGMEVSKFLLKFSVAAVVMFLTPFLYHFFLKMLTYDVVVYGIMAVQILICLFLCFLGNMVGDAKNQGATLTLGIGKLSITAFEIVKVLYLFSASALLSKGGVKRVCIRGRWVSGEDILIVHTICLSVFFLFCNELGTLLIVYLTGLLMLWVFGEKKRRNFIILIVTLVGIVAIWMVCYFVLFPKIQEGSIALPAVIQKVVGRFGTTLHPERDIKGKGYQGILGLEALAVGGAFGIGTERHRLPLPEASTDMIFANVVQTCGFFMGAVIIIAYILLVQRGVKIALNCKDMYSQQHALAITLVFALEGVIHIGYNITLLPIMGIPLYFVSQGFTAIVTSMAMIGVLFVVSVRAGKWRK